MKRLPYILAMLAVVGCIYPIHVHSHSNGHTSKQEVYLQACWLMPEDGNDSFSVAIPTVEMTGHNLIFCDGSDFNELRLLKDDGYGKETTIYACRVEHGTKIIKLPTSFTGEYEIQLVYGKWYLWGLVRL